MKLRRLLSVQRERVAAPSGADLARSHVNDISRMQFLTPGLTSGQQGADSFPAIRGAHTQLVSAQSDPVIGFYLDGAYQSRTQQQSIPIFDVARVEVPRGRRARSTGLASVIFAVAGMRWLTLPETHPHPLWGKRA